MLNPLFQSIYVYFRLCMLKDTPASLPFSNAVLFLMIGCSVFLPIFSFEIDSTRINPATITYASILSLVLLLIILYFLTFYTKKQNRWHKLASAMIGVEIVLFCILQPIVFLMAEEKILLIFALPIMIWTLVVKANILKETIEFRLFSSILLVLFVEMVSSIPFAIVMAESTVK